MMFIEAGGSPGTNEQGKDEGLTDNDGQSTILTPAGVLVPKGGG
jgi:hypothetical protein